MDFSPVAMWVIAVLVLMVGLALILIWVLEGLRKDLQAKYVGISEALSQVRRDRGIAETDAQSYKDQVTDLTERLDFSEEASRGREAHVQQLLAQLDLQNSATTVSKGKKAK